jgi:hypothetical protein
MIIAGIQIDYISERTSGEYLNNTFLTCEAGIQIEPTSATRLGLHIFNPVPNSLRKYYMPTEIRIGAGYNINPLVFIGIEIEKSTRSDLVLKTGFEYELVNKLVLRGGFSSNTGSLIFGIGYKTKFLVADIAFVTHERLSVTPSVSIILSL